MLGDHKRNKRYARFVIQRKMVVAATSEHNVMVAMLTRITTFGRLTSVV
jgi:hypothetical protein